jgi:hypothetical protein
LLSEVKTIAIVSYLVKIHLIMTHLHCKNSILKFPPYAS